MEIINVIIISVVTLMCLEKILLTAWEHFQINLLLFSLADL